MSQSDDEDERKLRQLLEKLEREMKVLDDRDDLLIKRAYANPQDAEERMLKHRNEFGEHDLYLALRERPEMFGDYPPDKSRFDDAYQARKQIPDNFGDYMKRRDQADETQQTLDRIRRERGTPNH